MATWPVTLPNCHIVKGYGGKANWQTVVTPFEAGYEQTRARFTRNRMEWAGGWSALTSAQFLAFSSFVDEVKGGADSFEYTDYKLSTVAAGTTHTVRFLEETIQWRVIDVGFHSVMFSVREV